MALDIDYLHFAEFLCLTLVVVLFCDTYGAVALPASKIMYVNGRPDTFA